MLSTTKLALNLGLAAAMLLASASVGLTQQVTPDTSHIPFSLPKDIKWKVDPEFGQDYAFLVGDSAKPGLYVELIRWNPHQMSRPHFHNTPRYITVVQGTWWVSSSDHYDPSTTYPLPAGSFATDMPGKVHWDGAKDQTCIIELVGIGPVTTTLVHEKK